MQFPPDAVAWWGILAELPLSLFSLGGVRAFPFTQLSWKASLSRTARMQPESEGCEVSAPRSLPAHARQVLLKTLALPSPGTHPTGLTLRTSICLCNRRWCPPGGENMQYQGSRNAVFNYKWKWSWILLRSCWNSQFIVLCKRKK